MRASTLSNTIDCVDFRSMVDEFIDGELDDIHHAEMEAHSAQCVECNDSEARRRDTRQRLRETATQFKAPSDFMARLQASLDEAKAKAPETLSAALISAPPGPLADDDAPIAKALPDAPRVVSLVEKLQARARAFGAWRRPVLLAAAATLMLGGALLISNAGGASEEGDSAVAGVASFASPVVAESVAWHRRNVPVEVVGPDPLAVRVWFADKVSFAVSVPDFGHDARLLGGRLSHVRQYEAAYLVYEANGRKLSVMLFDGENMDPGMDLTAETFIDNSSGYNVAIRERGGVMHTFTSDMDATQLARLVDRLMDAR